MGETVMGIGPVENDLSDMTVDAHVNGIGFHGFAGVLLCKRNSRFSNLPDGLRGSVSMNSIAFGIL
jgi:hypothetical protein